MASFGQRNNPQSAVVSDVTQQGYLARSRLFVLSGLRPPRSMDPLPAVARKAWTFTGDGDHLFRPVDVMDDDGNLVCTRFAVEFTDERPIATADEFTASLEGALSLFSRMPHLIRPAAAMPTADQVALEGLVTKVAHDYDMDTEEAYIELLDLDGPSRRYVRWLFAAAAGSVPDTTLSALRAFRHSVTARVTAYGEITDEELCDLSLPSVAHDSDGLSTALVQAYRAIEAQLGGALPARANRARLTLTANGFNPRALLRNGERLDAALEHAEGVRGVAAHGGSRSSSVGPRDLVRVQTLARYLLLSALRRLRRGV